MRHSVTTSIYILKKTLDDFLHSLSSGPIIPLASLGQLLSRVPFPPRETSGWLPLYTMVTFRPDIGYATARKKALRQADILTRIVWCASSVIGIVGIWLACMVL
jgi:kynurenine 3-monooxygenase